MARKRKTSPPQTRKDLLQRTVLEAAAQLFAERGFGGTSLQDIADALGISRPAVYYYFHSKDDILASLVEEMTVFSRRQSTEISSQKDLSPGDMLRLMVSSHTKLLLTHATLFHVVDRSETDLPPKIRKTHDDAKRALLEDFTKVIERGIKLGHFRPVDARIAAFAIIGMCSWSTWWFKPTGRKSADEIAANIADLASHAVQRADGRRPQSGDPVDLLKIVREDISHLETLLQKR